MYFPYLRGRQFELIALREYSSIHGEKNNIVPIIEPVKRTFNSMKLALPRLIEGNVVFALILNPQVGEIKSVETIINGLEDELNDRSKWIPAFIVLSNYNAIRDLILEYSLTDVMIICTESADTSDADFQGLLLHKDVKYIVSNENRSLRRFILNKGKNLIRLDDSFKAQRQNKDYIMIPEEKFSEEHLFYKDDGYFGFSDFTVLEGEFKEGGAAPYAVAIHLTYQKDNYEIWVRHFVSKSNHDSRANIQGKFAEAAKKAVDFLDSKGIHNYATDELRAYYNNGDGTYPGLGIVKKISIKNHLELLNQIIVS